MNLRNFAVVLGWSIFMTLVTGGLLFVFTYGDCFDAQACISNVNRNFWLIVGSAFVIYWAVAIGLFRRWSR